VVTANPCRIRNASLGPDVGGCRQSRGVAFAGADPKGSGDSLIVINHAAGVQTRYSQLSQPTVKTGQQVTSGTPLGVVAPGSNQRPSHLHFEVRLKFAPRVGRPGPGVIYPQFAELAILAPIWQMLGTGQNSLTGTKQQRQ
jgi:murein DD-endopeptidase MepM/ murein hydrolase activator NlpD